MVWLLALLIFTASLHGEVLQLSVSTEEAILMNAKTGKVLFEKNGYKQAYPASTTKIATALLTLHRCRDHLDILITAERESLASISPQAKRQSDYRSPSHWIETDSTHIGIKQGEELSLNDLLHGMLIASGNDAANVIAQRLGGTIPKFMEDVNDYLKKIGCKNTHFNNPHGLHHPAHMTTAYDLAVMAKEGLKDPIFKQIVSTVRYTAAQTNLEFERTFTQTNQLLKKGPFFYQKAIGVKTGTTQDAGKSLVAAAQNQDRILIAVALGCKGPRSDLYQDIIKMFDTAFNEIKMRRTLLLEGEQRLTSRVPGANAPLKTYLLEDLAYDFYPSEEVPVKVTLNWKIPPLPIKQGECVGTLRIIDEQGNILNQMPLLALKDLRQTFLHRIVTFVKKNTNFQKLLVGSGCALIVFFSWKMRKKKKVRRR